MTIDSGILTDTYDTLAERARRHTPGGQLLDVDRAALIRRTASLCGAKEQAVKDALAARLAAASAAAA